MTPIAVVGIDCRFPGAPDKDAFWRLLMDGVVTDSEVPSQRWDIDTYYHPNGVAGSMNTRRAHFIDDVDAFDNDFFGIAPIEAEALDPQQRLLLQASWRALEDAGIDPRSLAGTPTGVFVGMMSSEWSSLQMHDFAGLTPFRGAGSGYFMAANRISYHLNLTGPSMAIDSACSSSLMAVHQGCAALRSGETDTAIAAGANLILTPALSIFYTQAGLSAPDGRCKPFGQCADGIGRGEGVAAVVLRRLDDAVAAGQPIYAVVRSSVANHDGRSNGITAPNRRSQVELMRRALSLAEVEAGQIGFVEAHGTGTVLGDMIEANALGDIHKTRGGEPCLLGSVKGNIGHTEGSAGIAAFIKACLALHRGVLPPTLFGDTANPGLRLEAHGLRLVESPEPLPANALCGVSSFGLGGSNAHAVLESAPPVEPPAAGAAGVLTVSAPSEQALRRNVDSIATALYTLDDQRLACWCRTTNVVKRSHRYRLVLEGNRGTLVDGLRDFLAGARADLASSAPMRKVPAGVGLLCSGQGTQYPGMTRPLYDANPMYREHLDAAAAALDPHLPSDPVRGDLRRRSRPRLHQPRPAGVVRGFLRAGKDIAAERYPSRLRHRPQRRRARRRLPGRRTVSRRCGQACRGQGTADGLVAPRWGDDRRRPRRGAGRSTDRRRARVRDRGGQRATLGGHLRCRRRGGAGPRRDSRARRQSGETDGVSCLSLAADGADRGGIPARAVGARAGPAEFPLFSTVLGREVEGHEMDADYWANQICSPVRFFDAVHAARSAASADYVAEAGPRSTLLKLARQCGLPPQTRSLRLCVGPDSDGTELLGVAATVLRDGYSPDLSPFYGLPAGRLHRIPPYVFDTSSRFWYDGRIAAVAPTAQPAVVTPVAARETPSRAPGGPEGAVVAVIADVGGYSVAQLARSNLLADDLGYDSLLQLRLIDRLRTEYPELEHITVAEVLPNIHSVGDLVDFVVQRLDSAGVTELIR